MSMNTAKRWKKNKCGQQWELSVKEISVQYFEQLFGHTDTEEKDEEETNREQNYEVTVLKEQVRMTKLKNRKAPSKDKIYDELIKNHGETLL